MTLKTKLIGGTLAVLLAVISGSVIIKTDSLAIADRQEYIESVQYPDLVLAKNMRKTLGEIHETFANMIFDEDLEPEEFFQQQVSSLSDGLETLMSHRKSRAMSYLDKSFKEYRNGVNDLLEKMKNEKEVDTDYILIYERRKTLMDDRLRFVGEKAHADFIQTLKESILATDRIRNNNLIITIIVLVIFGVFTFIVLGLLKRITRLQEALSKLTEGDLKSPIPDLGSDEMGQLANGAESMRHAMDDLVENLDHKVQEKTQEISLILDNVNLGLCTISLTGKVGPESSKFFKNLFPGKTVDEGLYQLMGLPENSSEWLDIIPMLGFDDAIGLATTRWDKDEKSYSFSYVGIEGEGGIDRVMVLIEDITENLRLEKEKQTREQQVNYIMGVIADMEGYGRFLLESSSLLEEAIELVEQEGFSIEDIPALYRGIHTIKGAAQQYEALALANHTHELETMIKEVEGMAEDASEEDMEKVVLETSELRGVFEGHVEYAEKVFNKSFLSEEGQNEWIVSKKVLEEIVREAKTDVGDSRKSWYVKLEELLTQPIESYLKPFRSMVPQLAERLGKPVEKLEVEGEDVRIEPDRFRSFFASFNHLMRNAVDHGIEGPDERIEKGKPEIASISLKIQEQDNDIVIVVQDDGGGINPNRVGDIAVKKGLVTEDELKNMEKESIQKLIFKPGFSTKEVVTETSGRGVGLDALNHEVEKMGGSIKVDSEVDVGTTFTISVKRSA